MLTRKPKLGSRRLRSHTNTTSNHVQLDGSGHPSDPAAMAPARKKRKTTHQVEKFLCTSCDTERTSRMFPDFNPGAECEHLIHTCKECLKKWVEVQVEGAEFIRKTDMEVDGAAEADALREVKEGEDFTKVEGDGGQENVEAGKIDTTPAKGLLFGVKCPHPGCDGVMRNVNVQMAATKKVYLQFQNAERKFIGDSTPGWRWCLGPGCKAGQVHQPLLDKKEPDADSPAKRPRKGSRKKKNDIVIYEDPVPTPQVDDEANICVCHACGTHACVSCDRPYHEGETCAQFQLRTKGRLEEEDKTLQKIRNTTKGCPNCAKRIEKNGGCPSMWCSQCNTKFCWACATAMYGAGYCKCRPAPPPRQPAAQVPDFTPMGLFRNPMDPQAA